MVGAYCRHQHPCQHRHSIQLKPSGHLCLQGGPSVLEPHTRALRLRTCGGGPSCLMKLGDSGGGVAQRSGCWRRRRAGPWRAGRQGMRAGRWWPEAGDGVGEGEGRAPSPHPAVGHPLSAEPHDDLATCPKGKGESRHSGELCRPCDAAQSMARDRCISLLTQVFASMSGAC